MGIFPVMIQASSRPLGTCAIETESGSQEMTSDEEIQKQIRELEAPLRRRAERLRFIFKMTILGGLLAGMAVPAIVLLDISGISLATGIRFVDSMLYSMGGGPMVIVLAAMIWSIPGALVGGIVGGILSVVRFR